MNSEYKITCVSDGLEYYHNVISNFYKVSDIYTLFDHEPEFYVYGLFDITNIAKITDKPIIYYHEDRHIMIYDGYIE